MARSTRSNTTTPAAAKDPASADAQVVQRSRKRSSKAAAAQPAVEEATTTPKKPSRRGASSSLVVKPVASPLGGPAVFFRDAQQLQQAIQHVVAADAALAALAEEHTDSILQKLLPAQEGTCFEALCKSIIYQQLAGTAAAAIHNRFSSLCPAPLTPSKVLAADEAQMRACGLSARKTEYLKSLAEHFEQDTFQDHVLRQLPDEQLCEALTQVKGVGPWTVQMLMIFSLGRSDVLPVADLGVRKGMQTLYKLKELPSPAQMEAVAAKWQPFRTIGSYLMWRVETARQSPAAKRKAAPKVASPAAKVTKRAAALVEGAAKLAR